MAVCQKCAGPHGKLNDYGEFICESCVNNEAEAAYERLMESYHDGGATGWKTLQQQQIEAMRFK
jgi:hypothetical protein